MSDLVKRLHIAANNCPTKDDAIMREAAKRIEELERELAAEKAMADSLYLKLDVLKEITGSTLGDGACITYRKARGL